jgi:hypothetical protein
MLCLGQHILLAIAVGLRGASGNTLYWVLLLVDVGLGQHTLLAIVVDTLYCALLWVMRGFGQHTLLGIIRSDVRRLHQWVQNIVRKVEVSVSVSPPNLLKRISPHKQNHGTACFPRFPINLYKRATI